MFDFIFAILAWIVRIIYFTGRLLTANDFNQEQDYNP